MGGSRGDEPRPRHPRRVRDRGEFRGRRPRRAVERKERVDVRRRRGRLARGPAGTRRREGAGDAASGRGSARRGSEPARERSPAVAPERGAESARQRPAEPAPQRESEPPPSPADAVSPEDAIKDPFVLEFLNLKDEYSETELEAALIRHLEAFLLELGSDFTFVGRQRRLRIDDEWYRVDLLFFHRRLRCLVVIDLKGGKFTHADAGQMHMYLNYAREHWTNEGENPPVGLILCTQKKEALARYALEGLPNKVLAAQYRMTLPDEKALAAEIERSRKMLESRRPTEAKR